MKILLLTSHYPPLGATGHDVRSQHVVEALSMRGHRVQILTSDFRVPPGGVRSDKGIFRDLTLLNDLSESDLAKLSYEDAYTIDYENFQVVDDRISRFKPDLVLIWNVANLSKSLLLHLQELGVQVAYDLHSDWLKSENFEKDPWHWWWKKKDSLGARLKKIKMSVFGRRQVFKKMPVYERSSLDFSNSWLASESLQRSLLNDGLEEVKNLPVIHSALNDRSIEPKLDYARTGRFMWAGRLTEAKAPQIALDAIALLKASGEAIRLDIFGMGEQKERKLIRERINSMGLSDCVEMIGIRPGELWQHHGKYDALLVTSICDDPFPMTPIEAMMSGLPCILSRDGGVQEVVSAEETAILYEAGSHLALVDGIKRFLALPDAGKGIGQGCKRVLAEKYSLVQYVEAVENQILPKLGS